MRRPGRIAMAEIVQVRGRRGGMTAVAVETFFVRQVHFKPGCWEWLGNKDRTGYGRFGRGGRAAHRFAYRLWNGPIPDGLSVLHRCDNPGCVKPGHLWLGTQSDNLRDMASKGRHANQRKTHCKHGHEFTPENIYIAGGTRRQCRACRRGYIANWHAQRRAA